MKKFVQLFELANNSGSDKGHKGPSGRWSANNYADVYQAYLAPIREEIKHFCEIGLGVTGPYWTSEIAHGTNAGGGGSTKMWLDFFPNAIIHGLDINPAEHLNGDRAKTYVVDQSSENSLEKFKSQTTEILFDVIIDDGSHIADHQQLTLSLLWDRLRPGGLYFIEDLNDLLPNETRAKKHAPENADPTLFLFQRFQKSGELAGLHEFKDLGFLEEIDYLAFHTFPVKQRFDDLCREMLRILAGRGGKGLLRHEFCTQKPRLLVLRKSKKSN